MSGKKGKKAKAKPISLGEFLGDTGGSGVATVIIPKKSWAEDTEEWEETRVVERIVLPTAPKQSRGPSYDADKLPDKGPYIAYISSLPFEIEEYDIKKFFKDLPITSIRLPKEAGSERQKSFGYVEFEHKGALIEALGFNDEMMRNRKIRVDIAEADKSNSRYERPQRREEREDRSGAVSDWRAAPRDNIDRNRSPIRDRDRNYNDRGYGRDRKNYNDRYEPRGYDRDRGRTGGLGDRDRRDYERKEHVDKNTQRDDYDRNEEPKERKKLNLVPRSKQVEESQEKSSSQSSIFGGAKPVDTLQREIEIEKKITSQKEIPIKTELHVSSKDIFGNAKPVDTAMREKEIEEKLRKQNPELRDKNEHIEHVSKRPVLKLEKRSAKDKENQDIQNKSNNEIEKHDKNSKVEQNGDCETEAEEEKFLKNQTKIKSKKEEVVIDTSNKFSKLHLGEEEI